LETVGTVRTQSKGQSLLAEGYPLIDLSGDLMMAIKTEHTGAKNGGGY
jgi:hypothetical protein